MHYFYKLSWVVRALIYKVFFRSIKMPGYIGAPCFIYGASKISIGLRVRIFPGMRAECHGAGRLFLHDNISIGQGFHVICGADLHVGSGCLISGNVFVTDTDHSYSDVSRPVFEQENQVCQTRIGENCFIGIGARIQAGTILGKGCVVGANSVVRGVFPDYSVIVGVPGRVVKRYDPSKGAWIRVGE